MPLTERTRITGAHLLLHPQIPKPLHLVNPRAILGDRWWQQVRKLVYARAGFRCEACGVHKSEAKFHQWLEAHEVYQIDYAAGRARFLYLVALCHACHNYIHQGRMVNLVALGKFPESKQRIILAHGERVLRAAGLNPDDKEPRVREIARWADWRLIIGDREHPPKLASYEEWCRHFGHPLPRNQTPSEFGDEDDAFGDPEDLANYIGAMGFGDD